MAPQTLKDPEARRAYRHELRMVARLLRWTGMALVALGAVGIALSHDGVWFTGPSWVSFVLGWILVLSSIVRRVERGGVAPED